MTFRIVGGDIIEWLEIPIARLLPAAPSIRAEAIEALESLKQVEELADEIETLNDILREHRATIEELKTEVAGLERKLRSKTKKEAP